MFAGMYTGVARMARQAVGARHPVRARRRREHGPRSGRRGDRGLREYVRLVARAVGLTEPSWLVQTGPPANAYIALEGRLPLFPAWDVALLWDEERGWALGLESMPAGDLVVLAYLCDDVLQRRKRCPPRCVCAATCPRRPATSQPPRLGGMTCLPDWRATRRRLPRSRPCRFGRTSRGTTRTLPEDLPHHVRHQHTKRPDHGFVGPLPLRWNLIRSVVWRVVPCPVPHPCGSRPARAGRTPPVRRHRRVRRPRVLLHPQGVAQARLHEPDDVVVLVLGAGDIAGFSGGHHCLLCVWTTFWNRLPQTSRFNLRQAVPGRTYPHRYVVDRPQWRPMPAYVSGKKGGPDHRASWTRSSPRPRRWSFLPRWWWSI